MTDPNRADEDRLREVIAKALMDWAGWSEITQSTLGADRLDEWLGSPNDFADAVIEGLASAGLEVVNKEGT